MSFKTSQSECGREPFGFDWTGFYTRHGLDTETNLITSSTWTVTGGTKGTEFIDTPRTSVFLEGGTVGVDMVAENEIEIDGGTYKDCRKIIIEVF
ncbi:hypothetical protein K0U83_18640 [bacterium]|nr:hypothetical protein [bacterium]